MATFHTAGDDEIKGGGVTDVYFQRDVEILAKLGINKRVIGEVRAASLPDVWEWAVLAGTEEVMELLTGLDLNVRMMVEGSAFGPETPVLSIEGAYKDWAIYETSILGLICQASGVATRASRCRSVGGDRAIYSFGARRMHPAIAPMIERAAYIGGCDGVSTTVGAKLIGEAAVGTMPHALILTIGDEQEAFRSFDNIMPSEVSRTALVDTFSDEKFGALAATEAMGDGLAAVRLDTPKSRRGDFFKIAKEVRWELDLRGYERVKIIASGGIDERTMDELNPVIDAYGVGGYISNAPIVDFSLDIVEVEGRPVAKRGKMSGAKQVWRCNRCRSTAVLPATSEPEDCCGSAPEAMLIKLMDGGRPLREREDARLIRERVLGEIRGLKR